ncbi:Ig-like domain-containing protein [Rathayibacter sp. SD072]|uniref:Ig-like domain-containing protein n=1 Tax=Rathayibacter sp. SD072 TaxID=2781731 RepID=UPI001A9649B1|nr:Ig-like domain-containing protein [Rathayibacter sp. SD072]MBO0984341.1 hypothetical protein [Rathayibacter sp. SD072]
MGNASGRRGRLATVLVLALVAAAFTAPGSAALAPASSAAAAGDAVKPIVSLLAPTRGAVVSGTTTFLASAKDDVAVTQVSFWEGSKRLGYGVAGSEGWTLPIDTRSFPAGSHVFVAKARDAAGNIGSSASVTVTVSQTGASPSPELSTASPAPSVPTSTPSTASPAPTSTPPDPAASPTPPPTTASAAPTATPAPPSGSSPAPDPVPTSSPTRAPEPSSSTAPPLPDVVKPLAVITTPKDGATVAGSATLVATATDAHGVTNLSFWSGTTRLGNATADAGGAWTLVTPATALAPGRHVLVAKARDAAGNIGSSRSVTIEAVAVQTAPSASPGPGSTATPTATATTPGSSAAPTADPPVVVTPTAAPPAATTAPTSAPSPTPSGEGPPAPIATPSPTPIATPTATPEATSTPSATPSDEPTAPGTSGPIVPPTPIVTTEPTPEPTPIVSPPATPDPTPSPTATPDPTPSPTATPSPTPTGSPTPPPSTTAPGSPPLAAWDFSEPFAPYYSTSGDLPLLQAGRTSATRATTPWGTGVTMTGTSYLRIPAAQTGRLTIGATGNAVSVASWVRMADLDTGFVAGSWKETAAGPTRSYGLFYDLGTYGGNERAAFHVSRSGGPTPGYPYSRDYAASGSTFTRNVWQLHVGTYDGAAAVSYLDGAAVAYPSYTDSTGASYAKNPYLFPDGLNPVPGDFTVGGVELTRGPGNYAIGTLAKVRVWDRALSADEVRALYEAERPTSLLG